MRAKRLVSRMIAVTSLGLMPAVICGCGFILTNGPPDGHEQMGYFSCTEGNAGPIIDAVWAGLNVASAAICGADTDACGGDDFAGPSSGFYVASGLVSGVVWASSAGVGFNKTKKCRDAKRQLAERLAQQRAPSTAQPLEEGVQAVVLSPEADTLAIGERVQLTATAYNSGGAILAGRLFVWSSSNDAIASVSNAGLITAHANGTVVIAARTDNVVGTAEIVVSSSR